MGLTALAITLLGSAVVRAQAGSDAATTYKCPGNVYTNLISAQEAKDRGCTTIEGAPITVIQTSRARPAIAANGASSSASGARPADAKVDPAAQRQRDSDARRILEAELRREEDRLAGLKRDFNNGEPERLGSERNYQTYLDRVAAMKAGIARSESDVAALKRELAKLPP